MKTIIEKLTQILEDYKETSEEINTVEDLYEYSLYDEEIKEVTWAKCEKAINLVFNK